MNRTKSLLAGVLALSLAGQVAVAMAGEVTGKVVAVFHEKVQTQPNQWADKVSVTVADCNAGNRFVTLHYPAGTVSEDNSLSSNFRHLSHSARATEQRNQYMNVVSGHATLKFDDNTKAIQKTTVWGYNWACGQNLDGGGRQITQSPQMTPQGQQIPAEATPPSEAAEPAGNPVDTLRKFGRFGGF